MIVDGGRRAVIFDKIRGIQTEVVSEGTHFRIPLIQVGSRENIFLGIKFLMLPHE
jgi:hypothetical protein